MMKVLNLYAGIGGNRKLWPNDKIEVTAVEINPSIAAAYKDFYPNDNVIVGDAHQYLLDHYKEFDFIWASPPCQTHSKARWANACSDNPIKGCEPKYIDLRLYQEILFLQYYAKCDWVVENVLPYYKPLIQPTFKAGKHDFWANKYIMDAFYNANRGHELSIKDLALKKQTNVTGKKFEGISKRSVIRNMVEPELGLYVFEQITGVKP